MGGSLPFRKRLDPGRSDTGLPGEHRWNENQEVAGEESTLTPESTAEQTQEATPELTETPQPEQEEASLTPRVKTVREQKNRRQIRKMDPENRDRRESDMHS